MGKGLFLFCDAPQQSNDWVSAVLPFQHKSWLLRKDRKGTAEEINLMITKLPALHFWGVAASGMHCCSSAVPGASSNSGSAVPPFIPWTTSGVFCLLPQSFLFSCYSATEDCLEPSCKPSCKTQHSTTICLTRIQTITVPLWAIQFLLSWNFWAQSAESVEAQMSTQAVSHVAEPCSHQQLQQLSAQLLWATELATASFLHSH